MLSPSIAESLKTSSDWQELEKHIQSTVAELDSVAHVDWGDKEAAAIEGRARQLAIQKLMVILEPFYGQSQEKTERGKEVSKKAGLD